ncbi:MAG: hypothetical protein ABJG47_18695 [Ekhidna sp.]
MSRLTFLVISISILMYACESKDPGIDCSASDLSIKVVSSIKSDCQKSGQIVVEASGGDGEYQYSSDGENFQSSTIFENVFAGQFELLVKEGLGCTATVSFTLESEPTGITLDLESTNSDCTVPSGTITVLASGGVGSLQFSLDNGAFGTEAFFDFIPTGNYTITAKDEGGCVVTKFITVNSKVSLENDIMPIIRKDCAISGCHNGTQTPRLITNQEVIQNATRIKSETQATTMPRDRTLTQSEIDLIACWVDDGASDN